MVSFRRNWLFVLLRHQKTPRIPLRRSGIASAESGLCRYETIPGHSDGVTFRVAMRRGRHDKDQIAELAALADGSLDPERGAALREQVAASSELADRLAEQERAVSLARSAATEVEAPPALRARIEAQRRSRRVRAPRGFVLAGAAVTARTGRRDRAHRSALRQFERALPGRPRLRRSWCPPRAARRP